MIESYHSGLLVRAANVWNGCCFEWIGLLVSEMRYPGMASTGMEVSYVQIVK